MYFLIIVNFETDLLSLCYGKKGLATPMVVNDCKMHRNSGGGVLG